MKNEADVIRAEIPAVADIVRNECWFEGERRGCAVDPNDRVVQEHVAEILLSGAGAHLREIYSR
jgi:hypothetical protein